MANGMGLAMQPMGLGELGAIAHHLWHLLGDRLTTATTTMPTLEDWGVSLGMLVVYGAIAIPLGFRTGLLRVEWVTHGPTILLSTLIAFVFPSIFEEVVFRVWLLPHPTAAATVGAIALWSAVSLVLFILAHPLNALLVMTSRRETFYDWGFLALAGLLGVACTVSYLESGSLWPPVIVHWLVVVIWLLALGGDRRMAATPPPSDASDAHTPLSKEANP